MTFPGRRSAVRARDRVGEVVGGALLDLVQGQPVPAGAHDGVEDLGVEGDEPAEVGVGGPVLPADPGEVGAPVGGGSGDGGGVGAEDAMLPAERVGEVVRVEEAGEAVDEVRVHPVPLGEPLEEGSVGVAGEDVGALGEEPQDLGVGVGVAPLPAPQ